MLDKKKWTILIGVAILALFGGGIKLLTSTNSHAQISYSNSTVTQNQQSTTTPDLAKNPELEKLAMAVTVRILTDGAPGSGVIIDSRSERLRQRNNQTYTVLTCQHVVGGNKHDRVLLADGKIYSARVKSTPELKGLDLAVVEFESATAYQVVKLGDSQKLSADSSVYSAGFPNYQMMSADKMEETINWGRRAFRLTVGKVGSISPQSLPEGYSLGYTNEVGSGMSGGPVFNQQGELVGINGRLKYPVAGIDAFTFADGSKPSVEKFEQMEALSWAIPIATYQNTIAK